MVALQDVTISHLYVKPAAILDLKHHLGNNLVVHGVIGAPGIDEDDDGLLLEKTSNLHYLRVCVAGKSMNHTISRL
ncbi:hypothetical protein BHE74_00022415 [Ensete ventricosum]|nr:hypothetical protein GW17_00026066 [Ensete ventricosum]RWW69949.1 hypothetical protein BHE74_00022415 [Ensete ventricosum]RZS17490.1 hypothetical protein BHM03_00049631 [Ensete ventricosum]